MPNLWQAPAHTIGMSCTAFNAFRRCASLSESCAEFLVMECMGRLCNNVRLKFAAETGTDNVHPPDLAPPGILLTSRCDFASAGKSTRRHTYAAVACKLTSGALALLSKTARSRSSSDKETWIWEFRAAGYAAGRHNQCVKGRTCFFCQSCEHSTSAYCLPWHLEL